MGKRGWIIAVAAIVLIGLFCRAEVVPDAERDAAEAAVSVPEAYARDNWETKMIPAIDERAIDPAVFAEGMRTDLAALGGRYAARTNETSPWSFCLKGTVKVIGVENADSKTRTRLLVDVQPYDGQADMKIQISTVIRTNAIRDAVAFLKLDDFANQVEFAELTKVFNARVQSGVLRDLDAQALVDREIEMTGCVSVAKAEDEALIVPVRIAAGE